jgi:hypothetical protein
VSVAGAKAGGPLAGDCHNRTRLEGATLDEPACVVSFLSVVGIVRHGAVRACRSTSGPWGHRISHRYGLGSSAQIQEAGQHLLSSEKIFACGPVIPHTACVTNAAWQHLVSGGVVNARFMAPWTGATNID